MHASAIVAPPLFPAADALRLGDAGLAANEVPLQLRVLTTPEQRQALAQLRRHAPMGVEDDLGAGLMPFESLRDEVGLVNAFYRGRDLVATLRLVPSGRGLTAAERVWNDARQSPIVGPGNWEVGRLIVAPEERSPELLQQCFSMALQRLMDTCEVEHFYGIATPLMARLWRRFAMRPTATLIGASGSRFLLLSSHVTEIAAALEVPLDPPDALFTASSRPTERVALAA